MNKIIYYIHFLYLNVKIKTMEKFYLGNLWINYEITGRNYNSDFESFW